MLKNLMLKDFIDELGSSSPVPGGGSTAALGCALSSALTSMVFNLTVGKKSFNEYDDNTKVKIEEMLKKTSELKFDFLDDIDKDSDAFSSVMAAYKLPKITEEEKKLRKEKIEEGYEIALDVPYKLAQNAFKVYDYIVIAAEFGNKSAVSDAGTAALMLQSSIESAILNVKINLHGIVDEDKKRVIVEKCNRIKDEGLKKRDNILEIVNSRM